MCFRLSARHMDSLAAESQKSDHQAGGTQYGASEMSEASSFRFVRRDGKHQADLAQFRISKFGPDVCPWPLAFQQVSHALLWPSSPEPFYSCSFLAFSFVVSGLAWRLPLALSSSPVSFFRKKFSDF